MKKIFSLVLTLALLASLTVVSSAAGYVSREGWYVKASSVHTNTNWIPERTIDGKEDTYYNSNYSADGSPIDKPPIALTFTLPYATPISGFSYTPRQDNESGIATAYKIYVSDKDTGKAELINSGTFVCDQSVKEVKFGFSVEAKTVVFEITEGRWNYATCAEFNLLEGSGSTKKIADVSKGESYDLGGVDESARTEAVSREDWKVEASSVHSNTNWIPERTIDGNKDSYWHSNYDDAGNPIDSAPYDLTYTLPKAVSVSGFSYVPRQDNATGIATEYKLYASDTDSGELRLISAGSFDGNGNTQYVDFGFNVTVKKAVFEIVKGKYNMGSCAEFYLHESKKNYENKLPADVSKSVFGKEDVQADGEKIKDKSRWTVTASSAKGHYPAVNAIDGDANTIWHSNYEDDGFGTITSVEKGPHTLEITFPSVKTISGFSYTPRESATGRVLGYEFYITDSDDGEWFLAAEGKFDNNDSEKTVDFLCNTKAKKVMFKTSETVGDYGVAAEIDVYSENPDYETFDDYEKFKEYYDDHRLVKIRNESGGGLTAEASSVWREGNEGAMVVDGNIGSAWHSSPDDKGQYPFILNIDLGAEHSVVELVYYARTDAEGKRNGLWTRYSIWAGDAPDNLELIKKDASLENISEPQTIKFDNPVKARYYSFEITEGVNGYATCCELAFYEKFKADEEAESKTSYKLTIGSNMLEIENDGVVTEKTMDVAPYIDGGYTQIPLRGLLEEMGATFEWDGEYNRVTINADSAEIKMQIYSNLVTVTNRKYGEVCYTLRSVPQIKDSRTFVPLRFISENLGYTVDWDDATKTITVTK